MRATFELPNHVKVNRGINHRGYVITDSLSKEMIHIRERDVDMLIKALLYLQKESIEDHEALKTQETKGVLHV